MEIKVKNKTGFSLGLPFGKTKNKRESQEFDHYM